MSKPDVSYFVFDVESVADGVLVSRLRYPGENLDPITAIRRYRDELLERHNSDFVPYTFQIPVSVAIAKVSADYRLLDMVVLDEPEFRPHVITENFWRGWQAYKQPVLVTFNGRGFDVPLLELAAFRYGLNLAHWFQPNVKGFDQLRNRYNQRGHIDLCELMTNFGSTRFTGGLNLAANLLGKPGKMDVQGDMVQDMFDQGRLKEINDYCRCDVLDTYFVFLRSHVMLGLLSLEDEQARIAETKAWLEQRIDQTPAYRDYLENWGDWVNPWTEDEKTENSGQINNSEKS